MRAAARPLIPHASGHGIWPARSSRDPGPFAILFLTMAKPCPFCAEDIHDAAVLCKHCGVSLSSQPRSDIGHDQPGSVPTGRAAVLGATMLVLFGITLGRGAFLVADDQGRMVLPQSIGSPSPVVTRAEFDQLREGMSYEDAARVIGASGELHGSSDIAGYKTVMYSWMNGDGSNMNAMFQNGRLVNKAQSGLR
jgi:hypothetical protein